MLYLTEAETEIVRYSLKKLSKDNDKEYQKMLSLEWESLRLKLLKR